MLFREVFKENKLIGLIGWNKGLVTVRGNTANNQTMLETFVGPVSIEESKIDGNLNISVKRIVMVNEEEWINVVAYNVPKRYTMGVISNIEKNKFNKIKID